MFRGRYVFYALMLVAATLVLPQRMFGEVLKWQNQRFDEIRRLLADSEQNKSKIDISMPITEVHVIAELWGQLGNHLHMIGKASIVKFFAAKCDPPVEVTLHYSALAPEKSKLKSTREDIKTCFPNFYDANFYEIDEGTRNQIIQNQSKYQGHTVVNIKGNTQVDNHLQKKMNFILNKEFLKFGTVESIPSLRTRSFTEAFLVDKYYDDLIKLFNFDDRKCCNEVPDPDETVVHIRAFYHFNDKNDTYLKSGRRELDPYQMANELLGHLKEGDKVALVASSMKKSLPYKLALEKRGIRVRSLSQNRVQDFCFLMKTTKELVGHHQSTYIFWAGILSTSVKKVSLYHMKTSEYTLGSWPTQTHIYTHPKLMNRFEYPEIEYNPEI